MKSYSDLPSYLSGWQIGMLPFALNESTKFISPTKTPEYLAAGLQVISTPIRDVVTPYGDLQLVKIAADANEFVRHADDLLGTQDPTKAVRIKSFLSRSSWDKTWQAMNDLLSERTPRLSFVGAQPSSEPSVTNSLSGSTVHV
jgi:UDP-galactopyranose mutase